MKDMIAAIIKTKGEVPSLKKSDENKHGNYNYVSIDDYYAKVASVATANGLTWRARETGFQLVDMISGTGKTISSVKISYAFDMMLAAPPETVEGFFTTTVLHPVQGAQTSGSALSYADKLFMRQVFSVVTGEDDADKTDSKVFDGARAAKDSDPFGDMAPAKPEPVSKTPEAQSEFDPKFFEKTVVDFIDLATTSPMLEDYWRKNQKEFDNLKASDPVAHKRVVAAFKDRKTALVKEGK